MKLKKYAFVQRAKVIVLHDRISKAVMRVTTMPGEKDTNQIARPERNQHTYRLTKELKN
jgi:hypothetical protein